MTKFIKTGLVLSGIILFGAGCGKAKVTGNYSATTPTPETTEMSPTATAPGISVEATTSLPAVPGEAVIEYKDGVFNPSSLKILVGTKVTFVNKGSKQVWPASGRHPAHDICPGFDALRGLKSGEVYSYNFPREAECPFHNHLAPAERGSIEVKSAE